MGSLLDKAEAPQFVAQFEPQLMDDFSADFESDFEAEVDPPSEAFAAAPASKRIGSKLAPSSAPVPAAMRRRIAAELQLYIEILAGVGELKCPECAAIVEQHAKKVAERGANIIARYPDMAAKFISSGLIADIVGLGAALKPVAKQIVGHHITHTIGADEEGHGDGTDYEQFGPFRPHG